MKWMLPTLIGLILSPAALVAQTKAKPATHTTAKNQPAPLSDQEKNIRAYIELMRSDLRHQKTEIMGAVMQLDAEDSAAFWPIYRDFEVEFKQIGDGMIDLVKKYVENYDKMTADIADQLANKLLDLEQQRNDLKRKYYAKFKSALDAITAARFLQVENQIEKVMDLQIASELPVIEGPEGGRQ